jgi:very-short-patch-repair endonuclease
MRAPKRTIGNARRLRRALSVPEARLWARLRRRAPGKPVFRRQHPIGPYVLDFYCSKAKLAIELDGASHDMGHRPQRDLRRDAWLESQGIKVVRVAARELTHGIDEVADAIVRMAADLHASAPAQCNGAGEGGIGGVRPPFLEIKERRREASAMAQRGGGGMRRCGSP